MLKYFFIVLFFPCFLQQGFSSSTEISILTISPGSDLYAIFGHSAIRLRDLSSGKDLVFDFGTFDFNTPNFYLKFLSGKLPYALSVRSFQNFKKPYHQSGQSVYEQVLRLTPHQTQKIEKALSENLKPANRFYAYDFFFDNCSTHIADLLYLVLNELPPKDSIPSPNTTYRTLLTPYLIDSPWIHLGIQLILGTQANQSTSLFQQTFLPKKLQQFIKNIQLTDNQTLVRKSHFLVLATLEKQAFKNELNPSVIFASIFFGIIFINFWVDLPHRGLDYLMGSLFILAGLMGSLFVFMWTNTDHVATHGNPNLLWAWPTHLIFGFGLILNKLKTDWALIYSKVVVATLPIALLFSSINYLMTWSLFWMILTLWSSAYFRIKSNH